MEVIAKSNFARCSPRKLRLISCRFKGMGAEPAQQLLKNLNLKGARMLLQTLNQGIGNAVNNFKLTKESLIIKKIEIGDGLRIKRARFVSRGRVHRILKRTSHIKMVLETKEETPKPPLAAEISKKEEAGKINAVKKQKIEKK